MISDSALLWAKQQCDSSAEPSRAIDFAVTQAYIHTRARIHLQLPVESTLGQFDTQHTTFNETFRSASKSIYAPNLGVYYFRR